MSKAGDMRKKIKTAWKKHLYFFDARNEYQLYNIHTNNDDVWACAPDKIAKQMPKNNNNKAL